MTVREIAGAAGFRIINEGQSFDSAAGGPFCCDLLSIAMSRMPEAAVWVTVMANVNTLAVASLTDAACVILAENARLDETCAAKAAEQGITVLATELPIFEAALRVYQLLNGPAA